MSSAPVFWEDDPDSWDRVVLTDSNGGLYSLPGSADLVPESEYGLDIRPSPLAEGATYMPTGNPPQVVAIELKLWLRDHWTAWHTIRQFLRPPAKRQLRPTAFGISHPACEANGITSVVILKVKGPKLSGPGGYATVTLTAREYLPLKPVKPAAIRSDTYNKDNFVPLTGAAPKPAGVGPVPPPR